MTSEQLKNSILQFAVQGKLVPQNPHDEPASELLKKIKAEKERLIKEKVIKKDKPLFPIKEEEKPFEIPESWEWVRLGELSTLISKGTTPTGGKSEYKESGIGFVRAENVGGDGRINTGNLMYIDKETHLTKLKRSILSNRDLLICIAGTLGRCCVVEEEHLPLNANQAVSFVRLVNHNKVSVNYLQKIISSFTIQRNLISKTKITAIPNLTLEIIQNCIIPLPPLLEQQRIVDKIEELMPFVEQYGIAESELRKLHTKFPEQLRKSVLQYAVQGKLVPQNPQNEPAIVLLEKIKAEKKQLIKDKKIKHKPLPEINIEEIPFEIPDSWVWVRLGELLSVHGGKRVPKGFELSDTPTKHIYIRVTDMKNNTIISDKLKYIDEKVYEQIKSYVINKDDLYLTIAGTIGSVGNVPDMFDGMNLTENAVKLSNIQVDKNYLLIAIKSEFIQSQFIDKTNKVAQPKLAIERILTTLIPLPPLSEQKLIVEKVEEVLRYCEKLKM